jgi:hypothetical protein
MLGSWVIHIHLSRNGEEFREVNKNTQMFPVTPCYKCGEDYVCSYLLKLFLF